MRNFQDTFETSEWSFITTFSICMTVSVSVLITLVAQVHILQESLVTCVLQ